MELKESKRRLFQAVFEKGEKQTFAKGSLVTCQGDRMTQMYYIKKGIVRGYYLDKEGKEVTKCFCAEEDIFCVEGFLYQRPASFYIDCMEEVECIKLPYEQVWEWINKEAEYGTIASNMIIEALGIMEERAKTLLLLDAKERYMSFLSDYGHIAGRLKQKWIASYLGINEASLSRLKRKIDLGQ